MKGNRMRILVYVPKDGGKDFFRLLYPYTNLLEKNIGKVTVTFVRGETLEPSKIPIIQNKYDVVVSRAIYQTMPMLTSMIFEKLKQIGITTIFDIDDRDWDIPKENPLHKLPNLQEIHNGVKAAMSSADIVTTTTSKMKNEISEFTNNAVIVPNVIDYDYYYWNLPRSINDDYIRVGWAGSSSHQYDIHTIAGLGEWVITSYPNTKFVLGGFSSIAQKIGEVNIYYDENEYNVYKYYLKVLFPNGYDKDRVEILRTRKVPVYPELYKNIDILLAPLFNNKFNKVKSNLKLLEAAGYKIPIIASNIKPYQEDIISGINGYLWRLSVE